MDRDQESCVDLDARDGEALKAYFFAFPSLIGSLGLRPPS